MAISSTLVLVFGFALLLIFLLSPFIKLWLLRAQERLYARDGVLVASGAFLSTALLTFIVLDLFYYGFRFHGETDQQLKRFAEQMRCHVQDEEDRIWRQLDDFDSVQVEGIEMAPYGLLALDSGCGALTYDAHNAEYVLQRRAFTNDLGNLTATLPLRVVIPPQCDLAQIPTGFRLTWGSVTGQLYTVEEATALTGPWLAWTNSIMGDGQIRSVDFTGTDTRFLRLRVQ